MSFLKKNLVKLKTNTKLILKRYGNKIGLTVLIFFSLATISGGVLWWRLRSFNNQFISLPPITDTEIEDPLDIGSLPKKSKLPQNDVQPESSQISVDREVNNTTEVQAVDAVEVSLPSPVWHWPNQSQVLKEFGVVLWPTYEDWRMHDGIDIYVEINDQVVSTAEGIVRSITWDEKWGHIIEIEHGDDYVSIYKGEGQVIVKIDEKILAGEPIMTVEKSSLMEVILPNHIHFIIKKNGKAIDPLELLPKVS